MKRNSDKNKVVRLFLVLVLLGFGTFLSYVGVNLYVHSMAKKYVVDAQNVPQADAILVLGAYVYQNGKPSLVLKDRLENGYQLYKAGKAKKIIVSGDHGTKEYDEVNVMKQYLMDKGVPREDIFLDHAGFDTYDSMYRAKEIFGVHKLIISTQKFHIDRSVYIARKMKMDAYGVAVDDQNLYRLDYYKLRESAASVKAFVDADLSKRPPKFLGQRIPITESGLATEGR